MSDKQASGIDTLAMLPVLGSVYVIVCQLFLPWVSVPFLKYSRLPVTYSLWELGMAGENINRSIELGGKLKMTPFDAGQLHLLSNWAKAFAAASVIVSVFVLTAAILMYRFKVRAALIGRFSFLAALLMPLMMFFAVAGLNMMINLKAGRESSFINQTIHSYVQMTSWPYAQLIMAVLLSVFIKKLLNTKADQSAYYTDREQSVDKHIGRRTKVAFLLIAVAIPAMIFFGIFFLNDRSPSFVALCIIGLSMLPFCMIFEDRRPQAREILLIAVMAAIAAVSRAAFFMIPQFKPLMAVVIIAGVSLGAEAGFLTGAVAGFVSNFFFGQGPWTPWQMFGFGITGFLGGLLFHRTQGIGRLSAQQRRHRKIRLCIFGGFATLVIYGLLMDTASVTMFSSQFSWALFKASYITGFPFNVIHAVATVVFLAVLSDPFERKLERIKIKYGMMEV